MKNFFLLTGLIITSSAFAQIAQVPPHLDLEMTSVEYAAHLKKINNSSNKFFKADDPAIADALKIGQRLSKWIALVNTTRTSTTAIRLTSAQTRSGVPIDKPSIYSPETIAEKTKQVMAELPAAMKEVITSTAELKPELPIDDETFIKHARLLDKVYQTAARYKSVDPYRFYYMQAAENDVRGYYYLTSNKITAKDLRDTSLIAAEKVEPIKNALRLICINNSYEAKNCVSQVDSAWKNNKLDDFYNDYMPVAKRTWDNFFVIPSNGKRDDITWSGNIMKVPFNTPSIPKFIPYLQDNIQDEYRWGDWALKMVFGSFATGPYLTFQTGVVPHVNGLGGNEIVMDSNQPIEEYESQWTIRHEFGHVLGLPDCYHEFYDVNLKAYVNYQLDVTDLMCSRAGNMKERIYKELEKAYKK